MGGTYNQFGKYFILKNEDAHAWPEVWIEGQWQNADPTPYIAPSRIKWGANSFFYSFSLRKDNKELIRRDHSFWRLFALRIDHYYYQFSQFFHQYDSNSQTDWVTSLFKSSFRPEHILIALVLSSFFFLTGFLSLLSHKERKDRNILEKSFTALCKKINQFPLQGEGPSDFGKRVKNATSKKEFDLINAYIEIKYNPKCPSKEASRFSKEVRSL